MKKITLHRAAVDNVGLFCDAGTDLIVGDAAKAGHITAKEAKELVDTHGAVEAAPEASEAPAKAKAD
jgi:hypothetical protein